MGGEHLLPEDELEFGDTLLVVSWFTRVSRRSVRGLWPVDGEGGYPSQTTSPLLLARPLVRATCAAASRAYLDSADIGGT